MKKLNKLQINPERIIMNEELINLRGGASFDCSVRCDGQLEYWELNTESCDPQDEFCASEVCMDFFPECTSCYCVVEGY